MKKTIVCIRKYGDGGSCYHTTQITGFSSCAVFLMCTELIIFRMYF